MATLPDGTTTVLQKRVYQAGTFISPAVSLSPTQSHITITAERDSWPDTGSNVVSASITISYDAGSTWLQLCSFAASGGDIINPWTHQIEPVSSLAIDLPQVGNQNRQVQVAATVAVSLTTAVTITVT